MKKLSILLAAFTLLLSFCLFSCDKKEDETGSQILKETATVGAYELEKGSDGNWIIASYIDHGVKDIVIPDSHEGTPITTIKREAFSNCAGIKSVSVPMSISYIGSYAFEGCTGLNKIYIENPSAQIEPTAFDGCSITSARIPSEHISILPSAEIEELYISSGEVQDGAFAYYYSLHTLGVCDGVTFSEGALNGCSAINFKISPEAVKGFPLRSSAYGVIISPSLSTSSSAPYSMPPKAFEGYSSIRNLTLEGTASDYNLSDNTFEGCQATHLTADASFIPYLPSVTESLTVTSGEIVFNANIRALNLKTLTVKDGVTKIDAGAFRECALLTSATVLASAEKIDSYAFYKCEALQSISLGENIKIIGENAFSGCISLYNISFGSGVTTLEKNAFKNCSSIKAISIRENITSVGESAFENCTSLESITIAKGLTALDESAFLGCHKINSITVSTYNTALCTESGALFTKDKSTLIKYFGQEREFAVPLETKVIAKEAFFGNQTLTSVIISSNVSVINESAFEGCSILMYLDLSSCTELKTISKRAFYGCANLLELSLPACLEAIEERAFNGCAGLVSVSFAQGLSSIGENAFYNCDMLQSIELPASLTMVSERAFASCDSLEFIYIHENSSTEWHENWNDGNNAQVLIIEQIEEE